MSRWPRQWCLPAAAVLHAPALWAAGGEPGFAPAIDGAYVAQVIGSLALVLATLYGVLWLLRRMQGGGASRGSVLRIEATASVGSREKVVLLRAGERQLLLGVTSSQVNLLQDLTGAGATCFGATLEQVAKDSAALAQDRTASQGDAA
ncbi:MAG: flagellar biosynthetic protein FliO [Parahaliea sp.]